MFVGENYVDLWDNDWFLQDQGAIGIFIKNVPSISDYNNVCWGELCRSLQQAPSKLQT